MRNFNPVSPSSYNTITDNDNNFIDIKNNNDQLKLPEIQGNKNFKIIKENQ
jgi:hypothetical protein